MRPTPFTPSLGFVLDPRRLATSNPVALSLLVGANAVPILGVLLLDWDLLTIVRIYWLENGVIGVFAALRILTAGELPARERPSAASGAAGAAGTSGTSGASDAGAARLATVVAKVLTVPFFVFHYGAFWFGHGMFVWLALPMFFEPGMGGPGGQGGPDLEASVLADLPVILVAGAALFVSHGASFVLNWLGRGEFRTATVNGEMSAPYGRVIVLHLTIILGAFAVALLGAPVWALVVMVVLKTGLDLGAHVRDRERATGRGRAA